MVTAGPEPARCCQLSGPGMVTELVPAIDSNLVRDTIGAGDSLAAGFLQVLEDFGYKKDV